MKRLLLTFAVTISLIFAVIAASQSHSISNEVEATTSQYRRTESVRCSAIAKSTGSRCKNWTYNMNGRCHVHQ